MISTKHVGAFVCENSPIISPLFRPPLFSCCQSHISVNEKPLKTRGLQGFKMVAGVGFEPTAFRL
jgi:hypothetical protein